MTMAQILHSLVTLLLTPPRALPPPYRAQALSLGMMQSMRRLGPTPSMTRELDRGTVCLFFFFFFFFFDQLTFFVSHFFFSTKSIVGPLAALLAPTSSPQPRGVVLRLAFACIDTAVRPLSSLWLLLVPGLIRCGELKRAEALVREIDWAHPGAGTAVALRGVSDQDFATAGIIEWAVSPQHAGDVRDDEGTADELDVSLRRCDLAVVPFAIRAALRGTAHPTGIGAAAGGRCRALANAWAAAVNTPAEVQQVVDLVHAVLPCDRDAPAAHVVDFSFAVLGSLSRQFGRWNTQGGGGSFNCMDEVFAYFYINF
jgi:hypothetical protein